MQRFDVLAADCPVLGPHLLEASAGTGKTFAIEHVFVRLLLAPIALEQILAVTFTRAATRELKARIRANLDRAIQGLCPYPVQRRSLLIAARSLFDRCQIFTIHGFCYRMLREYAFEAGVGFSLDEPERVSRKEVRKFLQDVEGLYPEQMAILLREFDSLEDAILKGRKGELRPFAAQFAEALQSWRGGRENLWEAFQQIEKDYKVKKGNFQRQVAALEEAFAHPEKALRTLIWERGSLFAFLDRANRKVRAQGDEHPFFAWAVEALGPIVREAADPNHVLEALMFFWQKQTEQRWSPDEILRKMRLGLEKREFVDKVRGRYAALIVDEFQDTDPLQWEIFRHLFIGQPMQAIYLVGDPKQSIYRFRNADIYTYFAAREQLGSNALYSLDVNFRSSKPLLGVLNALFRRSVFALPKMGASIEYRPVEAGSCVEPLKDGKGAVHAVFGDALWSYAVQEIERLFPQVGHFGAFAILVRDRYQAEKVHALLRKRHIPACSKNHARLGETAEFCALKELIEAHIVDDPVRWRIVETGPFAAIALPELQQGLVSFLRHLPLAEDQLVEELLAWEQREGFSFAGLLQFLSELAHVECSGKAIEDAVQILTLHISKGLEFDIVFAFGLATAQPEEGEECEAEKLRQLYVAVTRAKRRLYIPGSQEPSSPMDLFCRGLDRTYFDALAEQESFTMEEPSPIVLGPPLFHPPSPPPPKPIPQISYEPCLLQSFTSLARAQEMRALPDLPTNVTIHSLPRGKETGIAIHQIFERLFSAALWKRDDAIDACVAEAVHLSPLQLWQEPIAQMAKEVVSMPLFPGFTLRDLELDAVQTEIEFLFASPPHFVKGFIDLVFFWEGKYHVLDWKTNWLGASEQDYHPEALCEAMRLHDYTLQAELYLDALRRHVGSLQVGRAVYVFVRGKKAAYHAG